MISVPWMKLQFRFNSNLISSLLRAYNRSVWQLTLLAFTRCTSCISHEHKNFKTLTRARNSQHSVALLYFRFWCLVHEPEKDEGLTFIVLIVWILHEGKPWWQSLKLEIITFLWNRNCISDYHGWLKAVFHLKFPSWIHVYCVALANHLQTICHCWLSGTKFFQRFFSANFDNNLMRVITELFVWIQH